MSAQDAKTKWVSARVQKHLQHGAGKIMEDSAISAARIQDSQGSPKPETDGPAMMVFERQEATDALSNLAHSSEAQLYQLKGEPIISAVPTNGGSFQETLLKQLESAS